LDSIDRPTIQRSATDLIAEVKLQSPQAAAERLAHYGGAEVAAVLTRVSAGFAQEILASLPEDTRERALAGLESLGIELDLTRNAGMVGREGEISSADSRVKVLVIPTNEELLIARDTLRLVAGAKQPA